MSENIKKDLILFRKRLNKLPPRQKKVIELWFGITEPQTQESIGMEFGVSRERIRQLVASAYERMKGEDDE